jgi:hypothetical protein
MSGQTADLNSQGSQVDVGYDSVTIVTNLENIPGGKTLNTTGFTPEVIKAGHLVIVETATGIHKPMPVNTQETAYASLPANHEYKGVVAASVLKAKPFVAIMVRGTFNEQAFANNGGFATPSAAKTALSLIRFTKD